MSLLKYPKNIIIGVNNYIELGVKLHENVIIGDNNKIYNGSVIYPNTTIGNNNVILNNNIIGEHPIESSDIFKKKVFNGLNIGNNNFLHVNNIIFNGYHRNTVIGHYNKILSESHINHDTHIHNNTTLYPRATTGGISTLMDYSTMGMGSFIQQNSVLGKYSMIGMGSVASHNVFPFYIYFNQKYLRFNNVKIPKELNITKYENELKLLINELKENNCDLQLIHKYHLPSNIYTPIYDFLKQIKITKL